MKRLVGLRAAIALAVITLAGPALGGALTVSAGEPAITSLVPADVMVMFSAKPYGDWSDAGAQADGSDAGSQLGTILAFLNASGFVPREGQVFADIAAMLPLLGRYEHTLMLLDVTSRIVHSPGSDPRTQKLSLRLDTMQAAMVFRVGGDSSEVLKHLNRVVGRYTNTDVATLTREKIGDHAFRRLVERRLPPWAVFEWGGLGDFFVVSFGAGAFERVAAAYDGKVANLGADDWYQSALVKARGENALAQWFISLARLEKRLDNIAGRRYRRAVAALGADGMTHDLWTIGRQGRAMSWRRCYRRKGQDVTHAYSDPDNYPAHLRRIVPDAAGRYAIIHIPTKWLVDNVPAAWVAAQSESHIQRLRSAWERLEEDTRIDISNNLIDHLGENVVIFDYPAHPLKLPIAATVAIEIKDRKAVETATDALLEAWSKYLDLRADRKGTKLVRLHVKHDDDGVWYLQAGILGPALAVTDRYLVLSWSPTALREALAAMKVSQARPVKGP